MLFASNINYDFFFIMCVLQCFKFTAPVVAPYMEDMDNTTNNSPSKVIFLKLKCIRKLKLHILLANTAFSLGVQIGSDSYFIF